MKATLVVFGALGAALVLTPSLFPYRIGVWAGLGAAPPNLNRGMPGCGACHAVMPGGSNLQIRVLLSARSLIPNQSISITTSSTGGQTASMDGGFSSDATAGTFSAGANSQTSPAADAVTHLVSTMSNGRSWTYGYTAPSTPGPIDMFVSVNTVNGDSLNGPEDLWGFNNFNTSDTVPTPIRLYVNAPSVVPFGQSCTGSFNNVPVLGAASSPTVNNAAFALDLIGAAPSAPVTVLLGFNAAFQPIDLSFLGVTGCTLYVDRLISIGGTTGAGNAMRAEGTATLPLPIPNNPTLIGLQLQAQAAFVDLSSGRPIPVTLTNGLRITIL